MDEGRKRMNLYIPEELHKKIKALAYRQGKTVNAFCLDLFWEYFMLNGRGERDSRKADPDTAGTRAAPR